MIDLDSSTGSQFTGPRQNSASLPLAGRRILVTRAAHQSGKLSAALRAVGAEPVEVPVLEIRAPLSYEPLDAALRRLNEYDWLIFTSVNTVQAFQSRAADLNISLENLAPRIAAIGSATAQAIEEQLHLRVSLTPKEYVAETLVNSLVHEIAGKRVLLARAATARDVIPDALRAAGAHVNVADAYRNVLPESAPALLRAALVQPLNAATFTSSSSVTHLAEAAQHAGVAFPLAGVPAISIGPITSRTLREFGWEPAAEAQPSDIDGLVSATIRSFS
jgi:uroporphyrinogen-III synthase